VNLSRAQLEAIVQALAVVLPARAPALREVGGDKLFVVYDPEAGSVTGGGCAGRASGHTHGRRRAARVVGDNQVGHEVGPLPRVDRHPARLETA